MNYLQCCIERWIDSHTTAWIHVDIWGLVREQKHNRFPVSLQHPSLFARSRHTYLCHLAEQRGTVIEIDGTFVLICPTNVLDKTFDNTLTPTASC